MTDSEAARESSLLLKLRLVVSEQPGRCVVLAVGLFLITDAVFNQSGGDGLRVPELLTGSVLTIASGLLSWVKEVGGTYFTIKLRKRNAARDKEREATRSLTGEKFLSPETGVDTGSRTGVVGADNVVVEATLRWLVAEAALKSLLRPEEGVLCKFRIHIYLLNEKSQLLEPTADGTGRQLESWEPGRGVTGVAFAKREYVFAQGSELSDPRFALTDEQARRYAEIALVAAAPIIAEGGVAVGVVTASSDHPGDRVTSSDVMSALEATAAQVGYVLTSLLAF